MYKCPIKTKFTLTNKINWEDPIYSHTVVRNTASLL